MLVTLFDYLQLKGSDFYLSRLEEIGGSHHTGGGGGQNFRCLYDVLPDAATAGIKALAASHIYCDGADFSLTPLILSFSRTAFLALALTALWYFLQGKKNRAALAYCRCTTLSAVHPDAGQC